jgi:hypothetical protein
VFQFFIGVENQLTLEIGDTGNILLLYSLDKRQFVDCDPLAILKATVKRIIAFSVSSNSVSFAKLRLTSLRCGHELRDKMVFI